MTAQILNAELTTILNETKRKNTDLRGSAEKSIQELKALPQTSEAQLAADLRRRPQFCNPILLACRTGNAKIALPAVTCLQRLVIVQGLAPERLQEALESLQECSKINLDNQLKILQTLPSLLQNYGQHLEGDLQAKVIEICTTLQQVKSLPVSSTASATLQQVVSSVFENVEKEDDATDDGSSSATLNIESEVVNVKSAAHDAYRIFQDICLMLESEKPRFAKAASISQPFGLELLEAALTNNSGLFESHLELAYLLRARVMPLVTRFLSERLNFALTVRTTRILCIILRELLGVVQDEAEIPLGLLNHLLESDPASNGWRRALCMETFRIIYSSPNLAIDMYALFDKQEGKRNFFQENMALFVRLASEKPVVIGLGNQSSYPVGQQGAKAASQQQAVLESNSVTGLISGEIEVSEANAPGISNQWSTMRTPCLDQLDKTEPPQIPETYVYSLALTCLTNLSDGLARSIIPLAASSSRIANDSRNRQAGDREESPTNEGIATSKTGSRTILCNPLELDGHHASARVKIIAHMIDTCWPALLATSSTFLNAALDADFYRGLIRAVQRFAQVAAILRLSTPRDAFMTTLAKSAVPPHLMKSEAFTPSTPSIISPRSLSASATDSFFSLTSSDSLGKGHSRGSSLDFAGPSINQRNLMCLRALLNLAIAVGSILDLSWAIIVESLQKADAVLALSGSTTARDYHSSMHGLERQGSELSSEQSSLSAEIAAVEAAVNRLLSSTIDYPNTAFLPVLEAFCALISDAPQSTSDPTLGPLKMPKRSTTMKLSIGNMGPPGRAQHFALTKIGELARTNITRLMGDPEECGWNYLVQTLRAIAAGPSNESTARLMAADITGSVALGVTLTTLNETETTRQRIQLQATGCLEAEVTALYDNIRSAKITPSAIDLDVHRSAVESVTSILDNCGDSLIAGWRFIFAVVDSAFASAEVTDGDMPETASASAVGRPRSPVSPRITKAAFNCVQLICSDFLSSLKRSRIVMLIDLLFQFCLQDVDMNTSLTTLSLFWNLSDFLLHEMSDAVLAEDQLQFSESSKNLSELRKVAGEGSLPAIWKILQNRLACNTDDERLDVRNGAVQTMFRIISSSAENYGELMWHYSLKNVVFMTLNINIRNTAALLQGSPPNYAAAEGLTATTEAILVALATLISTHKAAIFQLRDFSDLWRNLLQFHSRYLDLNYEPLRTLVFGNLIQVFSMVESVDQMGEEQVFATFDLWKRHAPISLNSTVNPLDEESSFVAYVQCAKQLYRLIKGKLPAADVEAIANNVTVCVAYSSHSAYSSDVDTMTTLQAQVLECFEMLWVTSPGLPSLLLKHLAGFVELPYQDEQNSGSRQKRTFVAFSKQAMAAMRDLAVSQRTNRGMYSSEACTAALRSLSLAVNKRYNHSKQGREPSMWRSAASAANAILAKILPLDPRLSLDQSIKYELLSQVVTLISGLRETQRQSLPANNVLLDDETFDLDMIKDLRNCIGISLHGEVRNGTPPGIDLNDANISNGIRLTYVRSLFNSSIFHEEDFQIPNNPTFNLYKIRAGGVYDPPFHPRIRLCYASLDELFALVDANLNGNFPSKPSPFATAAFPYLVLRCALPLKRYIADQPLRGLMPTPMSQRLELLHVLRKMKELDCDVKIGAGNESDVHQRPALNPRKTHLQWLVPLVNKANACARNDEEISMAMSRIVDETVGAKGVFV